MRCIYGLIIIQIEVMLHNNILLYSDVSSERREDLSLHSKPINDKAMRLGVKASM